MSQALDQFAHFGQGLSIVLPWAFPLPPAVSGGLSGGIGLFWRELSQLRRSNGMKEWKKEKDVYAIWELWHMNDRLLDILFGAVGGAAVGIAIGVLQ